MPCRNQRCEPVPGPRRRRAEQPEALAGLVLDPEVVAHGISSASLPPPLAEDPLGPVGASHAPADAAPGEERGRMIRQQRHGLDRLGRRSSRPAAASARASRPVPAGRAARRAAPSARARRSRPAKPDRAGARRRGSRAYRPVRDVRLGHPRRAGCPGCRRAARRSVAIRVITSMPKPGSMVSSRSHSRRVRRAGSRTGLAVPTRTASIRLSTR